MRGSERHCAYEGAILKVACVCSYRLYSVPLPYSYLAVLRNLVHVPKELRSAYVSISRAEEGSLVSYCIFYVLEMVSFFFFISVRAKRVVTQKRNCDSSRMDEVLKRL